MKVPIEITDHLIAQIITVELTELRDIVENDKWWEGDKKRDLAAIDLIMSWYDCGT